MRVHAFIARGRVLPDAHVPLCTCVPAALYCTHVHCIASHTVASLISLMPDALMCDMYVSARKFLGFNIEDVIPLAKGIYAKGVVTRPIWSNPCL